MTVKELLEEYGLEIDDIRWYCSVLQANRLISFADDQDELVRQIWSGRLSDDLHNMEEKFLEALEDQWERDVTDESGLREIMADAYAMKNKRSWK